MRNLLERIDLWADKKHVLLPDTSVVVGVSGGADSVCLLHVLRSLSKTRSFSVFAVHINHMLRGTESNDDESFVRDLCSCWQIPLQVFREDVGAFSKERGCSVEEAGRIIRYNHFRHVMEEVGASYIAVAHHEADQAETVFLHLLRGSGIEGLCGMEEVSCNIIRPFLGISQREIEAYIQKNHLQYRTDSSNQDNSYIRNTVRNELFPLIQAKTGYPVAASLIRASRLLKTDRDYLCQAADKHYHALVVERDKNTVAFKRQSFNALHPSMAGRCIRMAWEEITGSMAGLEEKHIAAVMKLSDRKGSGKSIAFPKGIRAVVEYERLLITRKRREENTSFFFPVCIPSSVELHDLGVCIDMSLHSTDDYKSCFGSIEKPEERKLHQIFDYDKIREGINKAEMRHNASLVIRNRLPGDIFFPFNSPGSKKLKEFFIDQKIPRNERERIPLLAVNNDIIWVIGLRTAENYCVCENTGTVLSVRVTVMEEHAT
ncbi:MAG: tRNA lysidine(34) synthetase TilS [Clostridiaceae bacterium]|nr:tRNA lysidine(34) synthetase TilS [Clostridiaceae bacterium]